MSRTKKEVRGPAMPCGGRHLPSEKCTGCDAHKHRKTAEGLRAAARDLEVKLLELRRDARETDDCITMLDKYAAEHEALAREAGP